MKSKSTSKKRPRVSEADSDSGTTVRDFCAHVIQLCHYVEDLRIEKKLVLTDYGVIRKKALAVCTMATEVSNVRSSNAV